MMIVSGLWLFGLWWWSSLWYYIDHDGDGNDGDNRLRDNDDDGGWYLVPLLYAQNSYLR